jgi:predicted  nucleic acid-binding Zn-ribbon protein
MKLVGTLVAGLRRRLLGISAEEIRYTFEDVRKEILAIRSEVAELRRQIDALPSKQDRAKGPEIPVAEA